MELPSPSSCSSSTSPFAQPTTPTSTISSISDIMQQSMVMKPPHESLHSQVFAAIDSARQSSEHGSDDDQGADGSQQNRRRRRNKKRDPKAPKRAANAYMLFCKHQRPLLRLRQPDLPFSTIGQILGDMWRTLPTEDRKPYEDRAADDRDRYKLEMHEYTTSALRTPPMNTGTLGPSIEFARSGMMGHPEYQFPQPMHYRNDPAAYVNNFPASMMGPPFMAPSPSSRYHPYQQSHHWSSSRQSMPSGPFPLMANNGHSYGPQFKHQRRMSSLTPSSLLIDDSAPMMSFSMQSSAPLSILNHNQSAPESASLISTHPSSRRAYDQPPINPLTAPSFPDSAAENIGFELPFRGFSNDFNMNFETQLAGWTAQSGYHNHDDE